MVRKVFCTNGPDATGLASLPGDMLGQATRSAPKKSPASSSSRGSSAQKMGLRSLKFAACDSGSTAMVDAAIAASSAPMCAETTLLLRLLRGPLRPAVTLPASSSSSSLLLASVVPVAVVASLLRLTGFCKKLSAWQHVSQSSLPENKSFGVDTDLRLAPGKGVGGGSAVWMKVFCTMRPTAPPGSNVEGETAGNIGQTR